MHTRSTSLAAVAAGLALWPAAASAHISMHPNAIPQGAFATMNVRVPNEEDSASISSVRIKLPDGVLSAQGQPPAGWRFQAKTRKLDTPVKTDDGTISTEVTEVDFTGGDTPPGQFVNLPLTLSLPDSAKAGGVVSFPAVQSYSNRDVVRWIGPAEDEHPSPTIDVTQPGTALLDVTGGDAGPPAKLPVGLAGPASSQSQTPVAATPAATRVVEKQQSKALSIVALIVGALGLAAGAAVLMTRRRTA